MAYLTEEEIPNYTLINNVTMKEVEAASFLIDAFKGISFEKQTYTERVRFIKTPKYRTPFEPFRGKLKHLPRIQVNDVRTTIRTIFNPVDVLVFEPQVLDFDEDTSPYFSFYPPQQAFWIASHAKIKDLVITYEAGYEEGNYPEALKRAVGLLAGNLKQAGGTLQWTSRDDYDVKVTLANNGIFTNEIKNLVSSVDLL